MLDKDVILSVLKDMNIEIDEQCVILNPLDDDYVELVFEGTAGECIEYIDSVPEANTIMALRVDFEQHGPELQPVH